MSEAEVVVPFHKDGEQLILDNFPVTKGRQRYALSNDKALTTEKELDYNDYVEGIFKGRVKGKVDREMGQDHALHRIYQVEVLSAELE